MNNTSYLIKALYDSENAFKLLYKGIEQRLKINGTLMVKDQGDWTMKLGNEKSLDEVIPVSDAELKWREKVKHLKQD